MSKSFQNIGVVALATMASRVLGLIRDMLVTAVFGTSLLASAFYTAFTLPNLFRRLLGEGALTAALVPTLQEELHARERAGAFLVLNQVATWLLVACGVIVAAGMVMLSQAAALASWGARWGLGADAAGRFLAAADLAVILLPYLLCVCLAAAFSAALQTLHRFLEPALSPIWLNVAMISLLAGAHFGGWSRDAHGAVLWLCAGALFGGFLQMAVPAAALVREGWRPRFDLGRGDPLRQIFRLMAPTVFGSAVYLVNMAVSRLVGLSLNDSAVAVLNLATRLMELPIGVFAVAVSTVVFPLIAKHAAAGDHAGMAAAYRKGLRLILVINVPAAVGLMVLAEPIIRVLFQRGAFGAEDTRLMQPVLVAYALGLPFLSFVNIVLRAFYARKDTSTPVQGALLSFGVNLVLSVVLMGPWGTFGLAIAGNVATVAQAWFLQARLSRARPDLAFGPVAADLAKVTVSAAVMGLLVAAGWRGWGALWPASRVGDLTGLAVLIAAGAAAYLGMVWCWRIEGRSDLEAVLAKLRARLGRG